MIQNKNLSAKINNLHLSNYNILLKNKLFNFLRKKRMLCHKQVESYDCFPLAILSSLALLSQSAEQNSSIMSHG